MDWVTSRSLTSYGLKLRSSRHDRHVERVSGPSRRALQLLGSYHGASRRLGGFALTGTRLAQSASVSTRSELAAPPGLKKLCRVVAALEVVDVAGFAKNAPLEFSSFTELGVAGALKKALG